MEKDEAIRMLRSGLGKELFKVAASYAAPILFAPPPPLRPGAVANGTIFFIKPGDATLAVTAAHVYRGYLKIKPDEPRLVCQIADLRFNPEERLIDVDDGLDLATFRVEEREVAQIGKLVHRPPKWPPDPPMEGRGVFFAGYRADDRTIKGPSAIEWGIYTTLLTATEVGARHITCQFQWDYIVDITGNGLPPKGHPLHSLSGAPVWTVTQNAAMPPSSHSSG
jgi:hypothetical protein